MSCIVHRGRQTGKETHGPCAQAGSSSGTSGTLRGAGDKLHPLRPPCRTGKRRPAGDRTPWCRGQGEFPTPGPGLGWPTAQGGHSERSVCCTPQAGQRAALGLFSPSWQDNPGSWAQRVNSDKQLMMWEELSCSFWRRIPKDLIQQQTDLQCSDFNGFKSKYYASLSFHLL